MINIHEPKLTLKDILYWLKIAFSKWIGKTKYSFDIEKKFSRTVGVPSASGVNTCTEGLFQIFELLKDSGLKGSVILPSLSYIGAVHAVKNAGFEPIFCDVEDFHTMAPSWVEIQDKIRMDTVAVLVQHYGGRPVKDIDYIAFECYKNRFLLIEDCATALGAKYRREGMGTFGDFAVWSFDPMKTITSGDGGMVYCRDPKHEKDLRQRCFLGYPDLSSTFEASKFKDSWWEVEPICIGRRSVLNNLSSALLDSQLDSLDTFVKSQRKVANLYRNHLLLNPYIELPDKFSSHYKETNFIFWVKVKEGYRDSLAVFLKENKIFTTFRYWPAHLTDMYKITESLPVTEDIAKNILCLPCHKNLSEKEVVYICNKIEEFFTEHI